MKKILNEQLLLEKYLASQFKFGFELEAVATIDDYMLSEYADDERVDVPDDPYMTSFIIIIDNIKDAFNMTDIDEEYLDIKHDNSIVAFKNEEYPFEWATPVMDFTPTNLKRCIKGLDTLHNYGIHTNNSCGFHVHLSFPNISDQDVIWIISKLALDNEMFKKLYRFKNFVFTHEDYASSEYLKQIRERITSGNLSEIPPLMNTIKYRLIRIHPQGTLEWRGPRNFMDEFNLSIVYEFFKLLYEFVKWISNTLSDNEINGISKSNYFKAAYGEGYKPGEFITDFRSFSETSVKGKARNDYKKSDPSFLIKLASTCYKNRMKGRIDLVKIISEYFRELVSLTLAADYSTYWEKLGNILFDGKHEEEYSQIAGELLDHTEILWDTIITQDDKHVKVFYEYLLDSNRYDILGSFMTRFMNTPYINTTLEFFNNNQDKIPANDSFYNFIKLWKWDITPYIHNKVWAKYIHKFV